MTGIIIGLIGGPLLVIVLEWIIRDATRSALKDTVVPELNRIAVLIEQLSDKIPDPEEED